MGNYGNSSVQFKMASTCLEKPYALHPIALKKKFPLILTLHQFQCCLINDGSLFFFQGNDLHAFERTLTHVLRPEAGCSKLECNSSRCFPRGQQEEK